MALSISVPPSGGGGLLFSGGGLLFSGGGLLFSGGGGLLFSGSFIGVSSAIGSTAGCVVEFSSLAHA